MRPFWSELAASIDRCVWKQAAKHMHGAGLRTGADMEVPRRLLKNFERQGKVAEVVVLVSVGCGGGWTKQRCRTAGYITDGLCECGRPEDERHRSWECAAIDTSNKDVAATQHLRQRALNSSEDNDCLWLRGTLAVTDAPLPKPTEDIDVNAWGAIADLGEGDRIDLDTKPAGDWAWYGDGSGGPDASDTALRRAAWSLVAIDKGENGQWKVVAAISAGIVGQQTTPRAEFLPWIAFLKLTKGKGTYHTDHLKTAKGHLAKSILLARL